MQYIYACGSTYKYIYIYCISYCSAVFWIWLSASVTWEMPTETSSAPNSMAQTVQVDAESPSGHFIDFGLEATSSRCSCASDACAKWDRTLFAIGPSTQIASFWQLVTLCHHFAFAQEKQLCSPKVLGWHIVQRCEFCARALSWVRTWPEGSSEMPAVQKGMPGKGSTAEMLQRDKKMIMKLIYFLLYHVVSCCVPGLQTGALFQLNALWVFPQDVRGEAFSLI